MRASGTRDCAAGLWSLALALLLLGPALGPGYVLSYDMVWVPDLALRPDFLGLGSGLPRAVPSDAVVSVLDEVVPGDAAPEAGAARLPGRRRRRRRGCPRRPLAHVRAAGRGRR